MMAISIAETCICLHSKYLWVIFCKRLCVLNTGYMQLLIFFTIHVVLTNYLLGLLT